MTQAEKFQKALDSLQSRILECEQDCFKEALEQIAGWSHDATQIWDTTIPQKIAERALRRKK